ncbi:uncharacterized protein LOC110249625 [Exaiptasia diaphana]|uniref:Uncharacterized protein n=1 Tax=Exaiptasia diaphana TaxID=2652724 RepID=A0A913XRC9_EXADI|nr:uncharacterized protein LOC110246968 [Exaiptasia diaphana]XP_020911862.1 uncharacterized protein LOC110249625 [Exaiptasia diaphana]KXJ07953.1 hypothetical protein AC249_AIPGENE26469 [Exaiptasia diaphana]
MKVFVLFSLLLVIPASQGKKAELDLSKSCIEEYKKVLLNYNDEKGTCTRLQIFIDCLSKRPELSGQMLDAMRYFFTQQAIFVEKLKFCPEIEYKDIKQITDKTDFAKQHLYLDRIKYDDSDQCAVEVHKTCVRHYVHLFSKEKKICDDVTAWINCYRTESTNTGCKADIILHFSKMLEVVGGLVIREIRRYAGTECLKMEL